MSLSKPQNPNIPKDDLQYIEIAGSSTAVPTFVPLTPEVQRTEEQSQMEALLAASRLMRENQEKPSSLDTIVSIDGFVAKYKILSTLGHVASFVKAKTTRERLAYLVCICENYQEESSMHLLGKLAENFENVSALFKYILSYFKATGIEAPGLDANIELPKPDLIEDFQETAQSLILTAEDLKFHPLLPLEKQTDEVQDFFSLMQDHLHIVRPLLGLAALFACSFGFDKLLEMTWLEKISSSTIKLANTIRAKNIINTEINAGVDTLLGTIYNAFGREYFSPEEQKLKNFAQRVDHLRKYVQKVVDSTRMDVFGLLRCENLASLDSMVTDLQHEFLLLANRDRSNYNYTVLLSNIQQNIQLLRERKNTLIKGGHKQKPVTVWLAGRPCMGKTHIAGKLASKISPGNTVYTRTPSDQYFSGYVGQQVCIFDDMLQNSASTDADEFMRLSTENAADVVMAALADKGTPFTSSFLLCTSNKAWMTSHANITSVEAFNRRRDYLVMVYIPGMDTWKSQNTGSPNIDFYATHPAEYYLFDPEHYTNVRGWDGQFQYPPDPKRGGFIGKVTFEELSHMIKQKERAYAEAFRQLLIHRGVGDFITVPSEPFESDPNQYDPNLIFEKATGRKLRNIFTGELLDAPIAQPSAPSTSSSASDESEQSLNLAPCKSFVYQRAKGILISGPPGIGKSHAIRKFLQKHNHLRIDTVYTTQNPDWLETIRNFDGFLFIDDFSLTQDMQEKYRTIIDLVDRCEIKARGVIATCNPGLIDNKQFFQLIKRRNVVVHFDLSMRNMVRQRMSKLSVEEFLQQNCKSLDDRAKIVKITSDHTDFVNLLTFDTALNRYFEVCRQDTTDYRLETFVIPRPQEYDICVKIPHIFIKSVADLWGILQETSIQCRQPDGSFRSLTLSEKLVAFSRIAPNFNTQAFGEMKDFVRVYNEEEHPSTVKEHVFVEYGHEQFGFVPVDGKIVAYYVDNSEEYHNLTFRGDDLYWQGQRISFPPNNDKYRRTLEKIFHEEYQCMTPVSFTDKELGLKLIKASGIGQFWQHLIVLIPLVVKGLAAFSLLSSIIPSEDELDKDAVYPESRAKRNFKNAPSEPSNPSTRDADAKQPRLTISLESRSKRNFSKPTSEPGHPSTRDNDSKSPRNQISCESRKRAYKNSPTEPSHPSTRDADSKQPIKILHLESIAEEPEQPEAYDGQIRSKKSVVCLESYTAPLKDGTLLYQDGENLGYYGTFWSNQVVYAHEYQPNRWKVVAVQANPSWKVVDTQEIPKIKAPGGTIPLHNSNLSADAHCINALLGERYDIEDEDIDLSSVLAFSLSFGIPYDAPASKLRISIVSTLFGPQTRTCPPKFLVAFLQRHAPNVYSKCNTIVSQQGVADPQLYPQVAVAEENSVEIVDESGQHVVFALGIGQRYVLTVAHIHKQQGLHILRKEKQTNPGPRTYKSWPINLVTINTRCDLAIFEVKDKRMEQFPTITHIFVDANQLTDSLGTNSCNIPIALFTPTSTKTHSILQFGSTDAIIRSTSERGYNGRRVAYKGTMGGFQSTGLTVAGDCGALLFIVNKTFQGKLIAMHRAGNTCTSVASLLTRQWIEQILTTPESIREEYDFIENESTTPHAVVVPEGVKLFDCARKCDKTGLTWIGQLDKSIYTPDTTRIHRTGILLEEYDKYEPAIMSERDPRAQGFNPRLEGCKRYGMNYISEPLDEMEVFGGFSEIMNDICNRIQRKGNTVRVFTNTEAINTPPQLEYPKARPIDRSGSAGFPHTGSGMGASKGDHLYFNERKLNWYVKEDSMHILHKVNTIIQDAKLGRQHFLPTIAYVKDEPLKLKKIYEVKKSRLFFSCPFEYLIAFRRYFLAALLRIQDLYDETPIKVGLGSNFVEWQTLTNQLERVSPFGFASDVENFDSSVPKLFIEMCGMVMNGIYTRCGVRTDNIEQDNNIRTILHKAIEGATVISHNSIFKLTQAQVSGNPATAIENSIVIWALYYLVWNRLCKQNDRADLANFRAFSENVALACYGDDNVCTVSPDVPFFNFNSFKREALRFGFAITDAAKRGGDVPDYQPLSEMSFLKRGFTKIQGMSCGPLELESIAKSFMWIRDQSYTIKEIHTVHKEWPITTNKTLAAQSIDAMWCELALHGEEIYGNITSRVLNQCQYTGIMVNPPTWRAAMLEKGYYVA